MGLPPRIRRAYGSLSLPPVTAQPFVFSNFVTTLDGVVSLNIKGHASGGDISGFNVQDRMVMGLLRAIADIIVIGSGTFRADSRHLWTPAAIFPPFAAAYQTLRKTMKLPEQPLFVVVTGSGDIDLRLPAFASGQTPVLVCTTPTGARRLRRQRVPSGIMIRSMRSRGGAIPPGAILQAVCEAGSGRRILLEGGPRLLADFYAAGLVDEQFLTLAPQIAGRETDDPRLSLAMEKHFAPRHPMWGQLMDARSSGNHLFLRYSFRKRDHGARQT